jgi:hypothetical protein
MVSFFCSVLFAAVASYPFCNAEVCPERSDDFVWENDKFGMRAYGPRDYHKWSGFDVFNKSNPSNVCLKWCHRIDKGNFHKNRGEGMDNYAIGPSRGVGGIAVFGDGEWKTYPNWISSRVLHVGEDYCQFELVYPSFSAAGKMTCRITLKRGEHFFRNDVSFEKKFPKGFFAGPGLDLNPRREHAGNLLETPGAVSLYENPKGENGIDGSTMTAILVSPKDAANVKVMTDHTESMVLAFGSNKFTYWAGASWSLTGEIIDAAAWHEAVRRFQKMCSVDPLPVASTCGGISKSEYLDLMEAAVRAYSDERLASYCAEAERDGVQEHGFPRLAANLAILVANGRLAEKRDLARKMMDVACRDAKKGKMPPKSGGNEFSVKELSIALTEIEKRSFYPREVIAAWRTALKNVTAERCYSLGKLKTDTAVARNWVVFACASEQARLKRGLGGKPDFVEKYVADQLRWFDSMGLYRDPHQPMVYDLVTRLQFAQILSDGFSGPSRAKLEAIMDISAEPTLKLLSACGEIPYGGRSNQFLHNNTFYSALCEWYAVRFAGKGDMAKASEFRRAAAESVNAMRGWLAERPVSHVKNLYPRESGKGVYSEKADIGCERYAYFDKYMITMGSWAMLGWYFADETIPAADYTPAKPNVFIPSPTFHQAFMMAGEYSAQIDYNANEHYDCNGLGRLHRSGAPAQLCLSAPCAISPNYRLPESNTVSLAIRPVVADSAGWSIVHEAKTAKYSLTQWKVGNLNWECKLSSDGMAMNLSGSGEVAMDLPAFEFDGRDSTRISHDAASLTVSYRGWVCRYRTDGRISPADVVVHNRNGRYRAFRATGAKKLKVWISIEKE